MALTTRSITQAIDLAIAIQTPLQTDARLSSAEQAQVGENLTRLTAVRADVNPNTQVVPQNRRNADATALRDRIHATTVIDDKYFEPDPTPMYDALDLMSDIADAVEAGLPSITSDLSPARP